MVTSHTALSDVTNKKQLLQPDSTFHCIPTQRPFSSLLRPSFIASSHFHENIAIDQSLCHQTRRFTRHTHPSRYRDDIYPSSAVPRRDPSPLVRRLVPSGFCAFRKDNPTHFLRYIPAQSAHWARSRKTAPRIPSPVASHCLGEKVTGGRSDS